MPLLVPFAVGILAPKLRDCCTEVEAEVAKSFPTNVIFRWMPSPAVPASCSSPAALVLPLFTWSQALTTPSDFFS